MKEPARCRAPRTRTPSGTCWMLLQTAIERLIRLTPSGASHMQKITAEARDARIVAQLRRQRTEAPDAAFQSVRNVQILPKLAVWIGQSRHRSS